MSHTSHSKIRQSKRLMFLLACLLIVALVAVGGLLYHNHQTTEARKKQATEQAQQKYQSELQEFGRLNNEYFDVLTQLVQSSNLTKSQGDWDSFYDTLNNKIQSIKTDIASASFSDFSGSKLDTIGAELDIDCDHMSYLLSLGKSNIDMQYQIEKDKALGETVQLATDQQTNQTQQSQLKDAFNVVTQDGVKLTSAAKGLGL